MESSNVGMWRQEMMMMEIEHQVFVSDEIDLDYEFDAARFFDFTQQEPLAQARQAELWFQTAATYAPSPFVANHVLKEEIAVTTTTTVHHPKPNVLQHFGSKSVSGSGKISGLLGGVHQNVAMQPGLTFNSKTTGDGLNSKAKFARVKRSSTLMKPTASQLAKQNSPAQIVGSRFQKVLAHKKEINLANSSEIESQAAKRQKLESGLLCKVGDVKPQTNFVHKTPKKIVTADQNSGCSKLKITVPREPDLETSHRAQRIRPKNAAETEFVTVALPKFKARPLNRKILNAPSLPLPKRTTARLPEFQEFHLNTWERAMQHTSTTSSSTLPCNVSAKDLDKHATVSAPQNRTKDLRRPSVTDALNHNGLDCGHNFKARLINKKILSSKGDIGVFHNIKQEITVPMEFNFRTEKRAQHNPPIELFSKLSLTSGAQSTNGSKSKLRPHFKVFRKDSKENMGTSFHLNQKESPFIVGEKDEQNHSGSDSCISEVGNLLSARRSLGIR
ncbi:protein TPX2 isoform X2 [Cicer arietinum]|uniref:Protein TPX2 isoform X1 n=1 Tax=Cicer arietinum TaxID=3827 RepID=A0A1S2YXR8_CICAR|nr:protein TPX2 isoform X1 [Cicer arietinum]